ncbi:MAG: helix-turn-helix transcriptional regulator [Clostridiales bacterium]|jgi:putative molybdopterin biosynthesis protein|nr:helix-turn-helix transcriptional regulator [Clostridiales bacterium]
MDELLNAQEVADILKVARNTVYEIIKRGELKAAKVGKQVRVLREDVDAYLAGLGSGGAKRLAAPLEAHEEPALEDVKRGQEFVICGQDLSLDILVNHMYRRMSALPIYRYHLGSYNGIYALYQGRADAASVHLWDAETGVYNVPYVGKMMPGMTPLMIRIGKRVSGFYVRLGNPKGITSWEDLKKKGIALANRERGSGTRVLLDEKLKQMGIDSGQLQGYRNEFGTHLAVATQVARGEADFCIGSEAGSRTIKGIEFMPLQTECYDLVIRLEDQGKKPYKTMLDIIASEDFKLDLESVGGYNTDETGRIIRL